MIVCLVIASICTSYSQTGFSDPIYAEAYVKIHGFDIVLGPLYYFGPSFSVNLFYRFTDVLLVNQTSKTLQNLCIDFATLGDLKIVERPTVYTVAPNGFQNIKATIKVSSTETGVIFGSILWDAPDLSEQAVILSDIHVDIMDYIKPAYCTEAQACLPLALYSAFNPKTLTACFSLLQFRSMWTEFEWENRVNVSTAMSYVHFTYRLQRFLLTPHCK